MWGKVVLGASVAIFGAAALGCEGTQRSFAALPLGAAPADAGGGSGAGSRNVSAPEPNAASAASVTAEAGALESQGDAGSAVCIPSGERDCTSDLDNDCDGQPDNVVDDVCRCVPESVEPCEEHPSLDGRGPCRAGLRTCLAGEGSATSDWGVCEGAVGPQELDSCAVSGDDSNCDATPNGGCPCVEGQTAPCGPSSDEGICQRGISTCTNAAFGSCVGAVFPATRNCGSPQDNDCDGRPDNTVDTICSCVIGDTEVCGEHPGQDNVGRCRAGTRRCEAGAAMVTSRFGACSGSVGPAAQDLCTVLGDDSNCDGLPNGGCACVSGQGNGRCANDARNSRCNAQGQCVACQANADCSLVSGGRNFCVAGQCIAKAADGSPCQQDVECTSNRCRDQFPNADGDAFPDMRAPGLRLCGNTPLQGRAFARADAQTDCCDADARAFPGAIPPDSVNFEAAGFSEANGCGNFDYDCRNGETSVGRQTQVSDAARCTDTNIVGLPEAQANNVCIALRAWQGRMPPCGETGPMLLCGVFGGFSNCVVAAIPIEPRLCF